MKTRRNYKDTLFRMLFNDKESLLDLYNAVNGTNYDNAEDLEISTLENAVYMHMKNDISFVLDFSLNLYEHQSTVNPNMPLRDLFYVSSMLQNIVKKEDLYRSTIVKIPTPRFIVFYNGAEEQPERREYRLSDTFQQETDCPELELAVTVLNINPGKNEKLLESCDLLKEYMQYVETVRGYLAETDIEEAVSLAVDKCIAEGVLAEFLSKNKAEAIAVSIFEYDEEAHLKNLFEEGKAEGKAEDIIELLEDYGMVPQTVRERVYAEHDFSILAGWLKSAARASSIEEFVADMSK